MKKILLWTIVAALLSLTRPVYGRELQVVTTFSILEDLVQQVGGERVQVTSLIARGADPHVWEPTPRDARIVAQADLLVANGGGFDDWLLGLVKNAARTDTPLVLASQDLAVLEHDHDHHHHEGDPHFWLSVPNAISYVEQITKALTLLSPDDALYFQERSREYVQGLLELEEWMISELARIPKENRVIVTYHNAFSYLAERYGFDVAEFLVENPEAEPSPRDLALLVDLLKRMNTRALFTEPQLSGGTRYMNALAQEVGGKVYTLYSDSLSADVTSYVELMRYNTRTLVEALE